jgi:adenosylmethionine-8-amino-7-oxononanoate aminotransferase
MSNPTTLLEQDQQHLLHPLHHPTDHQAPLLIESGHGVWLKTVDGKEYIDGLAGLWNVLIGHGNTDLAEAARRQMSDIAFCSTYIGSSNLRAIELAEKLAGFAYPNLNTTYFASGGAEANESAFKTARYYWKRKGKKGKYKVIARYRAYHGVTLAAMSATGLAMYWDMFEPRVPGFIHVAAPYPYRFDGQVKAGETIGQAAARLVEEAILSEGAETVAAVIAEPVQGAGGVIVPPDDYFPHLRQICDRHEVLLIADEVITGFGRTGEWFALKRWGVQPDIMSFAKGITSGYLPLGGIQVSDEIRDAILTAEYGQRWTHAYTYSGHPTCCAVGLKNLEIMEKLGLAEKAKQRGRQLLAGLQSLRESPFVGDVRGLGLMCAVEFVADKQSKAPANLGGKMRQACIDRGLFTRNIGDILAFAPPLIISEDEVDRMVTIVREALAAVTK